MSCRPAGTGHAPSLTAPKLITKQSLAARGKLTLMLHKPCCDDMRRQLEFHCADHADLTDCPDSLVVLLQNPVRFGIRVHDGGKSFAAIDFCPWCGASLSAHSRVDQIQTRGRHRSAVRLSSHQVSSPCGYRRRGKYFTGLTSPDKRGSK